LESIIVLTVHQVFTPNDLPIHTYVDRSSLRLEEKLRDALNMSNMVVSISGPSKSGKTVLVRKILSEDRLIPLSGAAVKVPGDLWDQALEWMGVPVTTTSSKSTNVSLQVSGKASGSANVPLIAKGSVELGGQGSVGQQSTISEAARNSSFQQIIREIGGSDFVIFVDDFHYIDRGVQIDLGRQIKALSESKVRFCLASVPHRIDDAVRSNPELSGRVASVPLEYWSIEDLRIIAQKGMSALNVDLQNAVIDRLAAEAFGIPQLMQSLCLNLCLELGVRESRAQHERLDVTDQIISRTLERTSDFTDYSSVVQGLHSGPKERGQERKQFKLKDGSNGDVYRTILFSLKQDPPKLSFSYDVIMERIRQVCLEDSPVGSSVANALSQMEKLTTSLSPNVPLLDWNENVLGVVEPYFLFFMRASRKLDRIAEQGKL
jgi:hypothetical protein